MANIPCYFWLVPAASIVALAMAGFFYSSMKRADEGTDLMKTIASHVRKGAMAYLKQQYKVVVVVFAVLAVAFFVMSLFGLQNKVVWFAFLTGGFFSGLAGFFGMKTATYASARTAAAAQKSLNNGLQVAFRSGAVMGLVVVGLALLDVSAWYLTPQPVRERRARGMRLDLYEHDAAGSRIECDDVDFASPVSSAWSHSSPDDAPPPVFEEMRCDVLTPLPLRDAFQPARFFLCSLSTITPCLIFQGHAPFMFDLSGCVIAPVATALPRTGE